LSRKWRRIKKALRLNEITKYIYLTKIQFFFICSGVNMPINLMNFLTPVVRGKNLVSRQSCKSRAKHNWQHYKRKRKKCNKCWQRKDNFPKSEEATSFLSVNKALNTNHSRILFVCDKSLHRHLKSKTLL